MILCFDCQRRTKDILDRLVDSGRYKDHGEVIETAIANLELLETSVQIKGSVVFDSPAATSALPAPERRGRKRQNRRTDTDISELGDRSVRKHRPKVPSLFQMSDDLDAPGTFAHPPTDVWTANSEVPLHRWIFGQYNRLLPAKVSCRGLANLLPRTGNGIDIVEASSVITGEIATLGNYLQWLDKKYGLGRDQSLVTAFPTSGTGIEKSLQRYSSQFVGNINKNGQLTGLLTDYKLVNRLGSRGSRIELTEVGWKFAQLQNPVLDDGPASPQEKLSSEEISLLVIHIAEAVPAEAFAFRMIIKAIKSGAATPESLDLYLHEHVAASDSREFRSSFLSSQRSGAVSRMTDLGLVERKREGVRVYYQATDRGIEFVSHTPLTEGRASE